MTNRSLALLRLAASCFYFLFFFPSGNTNASMPLPLPQPYLVISACWKISLDIFAIIYHWLVLLRIIIPSSSCSLNRSVLSTTLQSFIDSFIFHFPKDNARNLTKNHFTCFCFLAFLPFPAFLILNFWIS